MFKKQYHCQIKLCGKKEFYPKTAKLCYKLEHFFSDAKIGNLTS